VGFNFCDRVSADVPTKALTFSSELRLRQVPIVAKAADLFADDVSTLFHKACSTEHLTL
jgi:hypothetical protein